MTSPLRMLLVGSVLIGHLALFGRTTVAPPDDDNRHHQGPRFVVEPPSRVDFSNSSYGRADCAASGSPTPTIYWLYANGSRLVADDDNDNRRKLLSNGSLSFAPFRGEDYAPHVHAAVYRCVARNAVGAIVSRHVNVRAVVDQYYDVQVHDEFVISGNTAVLKCHIPSFVRDYVTVVAWLRRDRSDVKRITSGGRYLHATSGDLHVLNVDAKDAAADVTFACETRHLLTGEVKVSTSGKVIVTEVHNSVTPRIAHSFPVVYAYEGATSVVQLSCEAQGFPVPTHRWYRMRDKEPVPVARSDRVRELFGFLSFEGVRASDEGHFRCVVTNSVGEERADTVLRVKAHVRLKLTPEVQTVNAGDPATLSCDVTSGHPTTSTTTWLKDSLPLIPDANRKLLTPSLLRIESVGRADRGMYQCSIQSGDDEALASAQLLIGDAAPTFDSTFAETTLEPGAQLSLECAASARPPPRFRWTLDGAPLPSRDSRYHVRQSEDGEERVLAHVSVSGVQVADSGRFRCVATNRAGSAEHVARVNVIGRPMIRPMPNMSVVAGKTAEVACHVLGHPIESVTWEMDGVTLPTNHRQQVLANGTLYIHDVSKALDQGVYKCVARNPQGELASRSVTVSVMVPPLIDPFSFPRILYAGMRARISCVVNEGDLPLTFNWRKDGATIDAGFDVTVTQHDHFSSAITFPSITPAHSGNYTCIAGNAAAIVNYTASLVVYVPPRWRQQPSDQSAPFQSSAAFDCSAAGVPEPKITWKKAIGGERRGPKDYSDVTASGSGNARVLPNDTLLLEHVTKQDEGYFLCEASNGVGTGLSKVVYLTVHAAAHFETKSTSLSGRQGHATHLTCTAKGDPPISIAWSFNGALVEPSGHSRYAVRERKRLNALESELTVSKAQRSDSGLYKCVAKNAFGTDETVLSLSIQEPPDAPSKLHVVEHGSRTAQLQWAGPYDGNSQLIGYVIQYKLTSEDWHTSGQNVTVDSLGGGAGSSRALLHGLLPGRSYHVRVSARNTVGTSDPSNVATLVTSEEVPSGHPLQVEASAQGPQTLKVTWKLPRSELRNGEILGFYVGYKATDSSGPVAFETVAATRLPVEEVLLRGLRKFTKYSVTVKAFNGVGTGPTSDEILAFTLEDVPSEAPRNVHCSGLGTQSIHVRWEPPPPEAQNGILKGYKIFYVARSGPLTSSVAPDRGQHRHEAKFVVISAKSQETSLTGLEKFTNYSVQVAALTQVGDGVRSRMQFCRTREDVPGPPGDVKVLVASPSAVTVAWRAPKRPNGVLTKYSVYWSASQDNQKRATKVSVPTEARHDVQGLDEGRRYDFWVTASTHVGEGESTSVVSATPFYKAPARIASFDESVTVPFRSSALLPCAAVGSSAITRTWQSRGRDVPDDDERFATLPNGTLRIDDVQRHHAANYTCRVENAFGSDRVTHQLLVLAPPAAPHLVLHKTTQNSIVLTWKVAPRDDDVNHPVLGYRVRYKRDYGSWEEVAVGVDQDHVVLKNLHCGTHYQVALQAENEIGRGDESKTLSVTTKGSVPRVPAQGSVLRVNVTSVTLHLSGWPDGGCPVRHFVVQYRSSAPSGGDFQLVSNNVMPEHESITIGDLRSGVTYELRVTAHNDAGSTTAEYEFATNGFRGEELAAAADDEAAEMSRSATRGSGGFEPSVVMAVTVPASLIVLILVVVCLVLRHRKYRRGPVRPPKSREPLGNLDSGAASVPRRSKVANIIHDDVCPYATFNLSRARAAILEDPGELVHLRTFDDVTRKPLRYPSHDNNRHRVGRERNRSSVMAALLSDRTPPAFERCQRLFTSDNLSDGCRYDSGATSVHCGDDEGEMECVSAAAILSYPRLSHLTESAAQLYEQTPVPDLLYHKPDPDSDCPEVELDSPSSSSAKCYTESQHGGECDWPIEKCRAYHDYVYQGVYR